MNKDQLAKLILSLMNHTYFGAEEFAQNRREFRLDAVGFATSENKELDSKWEEQHSKWSAMSDEEKCAVYLAEAIDCLKNARCFAQ